MVAVGDDFPNILLSLRGDDVHLHDRLASGKGAIMIGCVGAFNKTNGQMLEGYKMLSPLLKNVGITFIGCLIVNDPFVLKAWAKKLRISDEIIFISDANGTLTKTLDLQVNDHVQKVYGGTRRCRDFVALLDSSGKVTHLFLDDYSIAPCVQLCRILGVQLTHDQEQRLHMMMDQPIGTYWNKDSWPVVSPFANTGCGIPFVGPKTLIVKDNARPSVHMHYRPAELLHQCIIHQDLSDGFCRIRPLGGSFGKITIEFDRRKLFDEQTGARLPYVETPRLSSDVDFLAKCIVIDTENLLPLSKSASIGTLCIVHQREGGSEELIFAIPLMPGGRDNFIASLASWIRRNPLIPNHNNIVEELSDENGINLMKYSHAYMSLYRYIAPSIYSSAEATW